MRFIRPLLFSICLGAAVLAPVHRALAAETAAAQPAVANISIDDAEKKIASGKEIVVLDVRTPKEVAAGRIEGSKAINFYDADFKEQVAKLDKSKSYVVVCAVGGRSAKACSVMAGQGFKEIFNVEGGMKAWEKAGKKTVK